MVGDSDIEELPDVDDDLAEYGDLDAVLRQGNRITQSADSTKLAAFKGTEERERYFNFRESNSWY